MSPRHQLLLIRSLFVLGCALPMAATILWAASARLPGQAMRWSESLSRQLAMDVQIESVHYPQPGVTLMRGLTVNDPASGRKLATVSSLEISTKGGSLRVVAGRIKLHAGSSIAARRMLTRQLLRSDARAVQLLAGEVLVEVGATERQLTNVKLGLWQQQEQPAATLVLYASGPDSAPAQLHIVRSAGEPRQQFTLTFQAEEAPVSCWLFALAWPGATGWGAESTFQGTLSATISPDRWIAEVSGELRQLPLETLAAPVLAKRLTGEADIVIERARLLNGALVNASASLRAGPGRIDPALKWAAADALHLQSALHARSSPARAYEQIALAVGMNANGIAMRGICADAPAGTVLVSAGGAELATREPSHSILPLSSLFQTLAPADGQGLATREAAALAALLPLPSLGALATGEEKQAALDEETLR